MRSNYKKFGPEFFTFKLYNFFTSIRVPIFWILLLFWVIDIFCSRLDTNSWLPAWSSEKLGSIAARIIYFLLSIGAFTAAFITIGIELIKKSESTQKITAIFSNIVKYAIYPFVVAAFIGLILFLDEVNIYDANSFSFFLLTVFLVINSIYTTIRAAENLVHKASQEDGST
jgi:hypothetical protein